MTLRSGTGFDTITGLWQTIFRLPVAERIEKFGNSDIRRQLAQDADAMAARGGVLSENARLDNYRVVLTGSEANRRYEGRRIGDIATEEARAPIDMMLDIAVADGLRTIFAPERGGHDQATFELRGRLWADDRTLIGASDAGAHLDLIDTFAFSTTVLQKGVREHGVITLEAAVHELTQRPARYFGLIDRGTIAKGFHADLVIFDPATVGRAPTALRHDLPGDAEAYRLYAEATGIDHVLVNGVEIVRDGVHTGSLPGTVLRSGRDTRTVAMDALRDGRRVG
jgi:N-acyl-D-aspartate/D-glutamate deacylase